MTKKQSLRYVKIYLAFVGGGFLTIYALAAAVLWTGNNDFAVRILMYCIWIYFIGVVILFAMTWSAIISLGVSMFRFKEIMPKRHKKLVDELPYFIWDELK